MKYLSQVFFFFLILTTATKAIASAEDCELPAVPQLKAFNDFELNALARNCYDEPFDQTSNLKTGETLNFFLTDPARNTFQNQSKICKCIIDKNAHFTGADNLFSIKSENIFSSEKYALIHLKRSASKFANQSQLTTNMAILQAQSMGAGTAEKYNLHQTMSINADYKKFVIDAISSNTKKGLGETSKNTDALAKEIQSVFDKKAAEREIAPISDILTDQPLKGESCYPMQLYLFTKTLPALPIFYTSIEKTFKKEDWDITSLKSSFKFSRPDITKDEKDRIKTRIEFLEKNPMLKLALNSGNVKAQQRAFNLIKDNIGSFKCIDSDKTCDTQFVESDSIKRYYKSMNEFMNDPEMISIVQNGREHDLNAQLFELIQDSRSKNDIGTLDEYAEEIYGTSLVDCQRNLSSQTKKFQDSIPLNYGITEDRNVSAFGLGINKRLTSFINDKEVQCNNAMAQYCRDVKFDSNIEVTQGMMSSSNLNGSEIDELYEQIMDEMNPNPERNPKYQRETQSFCMNERRKYNGKPVDFATYQANFCKVNDNKNTCNDKKKLFLSYVKLDRDKNSKDDWFNTMGSVAASSSMADIEVASLSATEKSKFTSITTFESVFQERSKKESPKLNEITERSLLSSRLIEDGSTTPSQDNSSQVTGVPAYSPSVSIMGSKDYVYALNSARDTKKEIDEEIKVTKESLVYNRERLSRENTTPEFKDNISQRVKLLEDLLAEKEKSSQEYQSIISKLIDKRDDQKSIPESTKVASLDPKTTIDSSAVASSKYQTSPIFTQAKSSEMDESSRSPASVAENFSTSGGVKGGAAQMGSSIGGQSASASNRGSSGTGKVNTALLSKYGITVQDNDSSIQIAPDKDRGQISTLLSSANKSDLGVEVSKIEYEKFKNNDISALNKLYSDRIQMLDTDVVRLMIHSKGIEDSLEFYAIKEDGRVVFQPVRKTRLTDLQNALNQ